MLDICSAPPARTAPAAPSRARGEPAELRRRRAGERAAEIADRGAHAPREQDARLAHRLRVVRATSRFTGRVLLVDAAARFWFAIVFCSAFLSRPIAGLAR